MTRKTVFAFALAFLAPVGLAAAGSIMRVPRITAAELHELVVAKKVVVVDVRGLNRYQAQHIPGAIPVPLGTEAAHGAKLAKETRPVVTYCACSAEQTSARSALAFAELGVKDVRALKGGLAAWEQAGFPLE